LKFIRAVWNLANLRINGQNSNGVFGFPDLSGSRFFCENPTRKMTVVLDLDEPQRQTFVEFLKTLPYVKVISEIDSTDADWNRQTSQQFMDGYADDVYDAL